MDLTHSIKEYEFLILIIEEQNTRFGKEVNANFPAVGLILHGSTLKKTYEETVSPRTITIKQKTAIKLTLFYPGTRVKTWRVDARR